jgi:hypothetical protein
MMSVSWKSPSVMDGRIRAFRPVVVRNPVDHAPIIVVSPRPKEGSHPSHTAKMRMRKMPMRKVGSDTPMSETVRKTRESQCCV